jgi:hypothetical protein
MAARPADQQGEAGKRKRLDMSCKRAVPAEAAKGRAHKSEIARHDAFR